MVDKQRILIVDDDNNIAELISLYLVKECYETLIVNDGESALARIPEFNPDLMLLDIMLPGIDGYEVCRRVRTTSELPIIMLSAKGETFDKVLGLQLGADDYIEKPFDSKEMVARVKAVLRRSVSKAVSVTTQADPDIDAVSYPDLLINLTNYSVTYKGRTIEMPPKELELLDRIWGYEYSGDTRTVDVHIKRIREKIGDHENWRISTIWGKGYKFETT